MPAKRCILIAAVLIVVVLSAKVTSWVYCSAYNYRTGASELLTGYDVNKIVNAPLGKYNLELENRFVYTDGQQPDRQERLNDRIQLSLDRKWDNAYIKAFYRGEWFDKNYGLIFPEGALWPYFERNSNQAGFSGKFVAGNFDYQLNARYRSYYFKPVFPDFSDNVKDSNLKTDAELNYAFYNPLAIYISGVSKSSLDDRSSEFDYQSVGTGLKLNLPISPIRHLEGQTGIQWRKSEFLSALDGDRLIPVTNSLRYTQLVTPQLTGFISYENRCFYDRENQEMLFNSQFLRASGKYTFVYDLSHGSFLELGAKYSNRGNVKYKSSAAFTHGEMKVIDRFYLGGGVNLMPKRLNRYQAVARYFISPWNEVFVDFTYIDDFEYNDLATHTSAGVRLMF